MAGFSIRAGGLRNLDLHVVVEVEDALGPGQIVLGLTAPRSGRTGTNRPGERQPLDQFLCSADGRGVVEPFEYVVLAIRGTSRRPASNSITSPMVARVPSMREERTASRVVRGASRRLALGRAASIPSYRATSPAAGPSSGISRLQSR